MTTQNNLVLRNPEANLHSGDKDFTKLKQGNAPGQAVTEHECTRHLSAVGDAVYVIGGKWKLRIIVALKHGHKRFNDIQRAVTGISARVLSTELKDLELNGFVSRHVYPYTPVTVEYLLTEYTDSLEPVLTALGEWGYRHREKVMADSRSGKVTKTT
ncbi:MAG: transcriptional regulator [Chitinophagaceae bacterium]|nr:MAG: transcriptional regulator [Chitinophagaceae bacterium]